VNDCTPANLVSPLAAVVEIAYLEDLECLAALADQTMPGRAV